MSSNQDIYLKVSQDSIHRLLAQIDRHPFSSSYGSWHREYWQHRTSDFSSSARHQGMLSLALFYRIDSASNLLARNDQVLKWIYASIHDLLGLQHSDGSFDEWYPNERGWAGPTGYVIYALAKTWELLAQGSELENSEMRKANSHKVEAACLKACHFLNLYEEIDVLGNHQAMALLAVAQVQATFPLNASVLQDVYEKLLARFLSSIDPEGWNLEYDGADPGYQTATLSFLARVHRINQDERIMVLIEPMLNFVSHFFFDEKSFAGIVGSRSTRTVFHFGFEYWSRHFSMAQKLARVSRRMLESGALLSPQSQEDHYVMYRLPEFLEAHCEINAVPNSEINVAETTNLPSQLSSFHRYFPNAGIYVRKGEENYCVVNLKKGASFKLIKSSGQIVEDAGWVVRTRDAKLFTNSYIREDRKLAVNDAQAVSVSGVASRFSSPRFNVWTFAAFRLFMKIFAWRPGIARKMKSLIRSRIMTSKISDCELEFVRSLSFLNSEVIVTDNVLYKNSEKVFGFYFGGIFSTRSVPQSRYFEELELNNGLMELSQEQLAEFRTRGEWTSTRIF